MRDTKTFRGVMVRALVLGLLAGMSGVVCAQRRGAPGFRRVSGYSIGYSGAYANQNGQFSRQQRAAPIERRPPLGAVVRPGAGGERHLIGPDGRRSGEHMAEWMSQHSGMTLAQQQQALDREPGFRQLPVQTQLRMHARLAQLNAMAPMQRQRYLEHTEAIERMNPVQRSEVRGAMRELGSLPLRQQRQVVRCFRELRMLPPRQRMGALASPQYAWLNYEQRTTLTNLIQIAPMLPTE
ncbi:MAG: DUF3106 domain-containing protein [Acidobacteriaceae bacterium]